MMMMMTGDTLVSRSLHPLPPQHLGSDALPEADLGGWAGRLDTKIVVVVVGQVGWTLG